MNSTLKERLEAALAAMAAPPSQADIARAAGIKAPSVNAWFSGSTKSLKGRNLVKVAQMLNVRPDWLESGRGPMKAAGDISVTGYRVSEAAASYGIDSQEINLIEARGSCGGGSVNWDVERRSPLVKETSWFKRYDVQPENVIALFAHGDSMADFIIDGDIVLFDTSQTEPRSGNIFLIEHPDGLKIKKLRREIDGTWVLESLNSDKRRFPDERVPAELDVPLLIKGRFIYRQGG